MAHIGVCCFTKTLPSNKTKGKFPNGENSICIEYDKEKGYHIGIPENCIKCIYIYPNTDDEFVKKNQEIGI